MMELKSIGVLSCGKLLGALYALFGLIAGGFIALFSLAGAGVQAQGVANGPNPFAVAGAGVAAVFILPILYGIGGFIGGIISAFLYNIVAGMIGGIEMNFERASERYESQDYS